MGESRRGPGRTLPPGRAVLFAGLTIGLLDILDAFIFFGFRGVTPDRILQSIAAGLLGSRSFQGGAATAALGLGLHFLNATIIGAVYIGASRWLTTLARRPWLWGPIYGVAVYCVMNFVVIPLSAIARRPITTPVLINGILIHVFGVGLPAALFARAAARRSFP